jgi:hypothetical protein
MTIELTSYSEWVNRCKDLGLDGPHRLAGAPLGKQFVDGKGTAAIWNAEKVRGFIFVRPASPQEAKP